MNQISIVIPAYNEEKRIGRTLLDYLTYFQDKNAEIIVVLNGCRDNTQKIVAEYENKFQKILKIIDIKEAIGKGGAVYRGFSEAKGDLIGFVDADRATESMEFDKLINNIGSADGIIASRWLKNSLVFNRSFTRRFASKCYAILVKLIFHLPLTDTQCGAKLFKRKPLLAVLPKLKENGMVFDVELLYQLHLHNFKIKEIATVWIDQPGSMALGKQALFIKRGLQMVNQLLKIKKYGQESNLR